MNGLRILRRGYATKRPKPTTKALAFQSKRAPLPDTAQEPTPNASANPPVLMQEAAAFARRASTPMAVRIRRIKANRDQVKTSLTASEEDTYARLRNIHPEREDLDTPHVWGTALYERRSRIRGLEEVAPDDDSLDDVINIGEDMGYGSGRVRIIGKRVYLPNIVLQFIRNRTPIGKPYNPYEATFRIPKNLTKHDLRSYLYFVYNVKTTYIRTDNYIGKFKRIGKSRTKVRERGGTFKRAVIGLKDPFYPPAMLEDMSPPQRTALKKALETDFYLSDRKNIRDEQVELTKHPRTALGDKATVFRTGLATSRAKIMAKVLEKRKERDKTIQKEIEQLKKKQGVRLQI